MHRILLIDDHPLCRCGMVTLLQAEPDIQVCGEAESVAEAIQRINELKPDMLVIDLNLAHGSGLQLIKHVRARDSKLPILVMSMYDEQLFAERVIRAGANGYINKADAVTNIIPAIRQILKGRLYLSGSIQETLLRTKIQGQRDPSAPAESRLSNRELEIYIMLGQGYATKRIATELHLSSKTVDSHKEHIKEKLDITDNTSLIQRAVTWTMSR